MSNATTSAGKNQNSPTKATKTRQYRLKTDDIVTPPRDSAQRSSPSSSLSGSQDSQLHCSESMLSSTQSSSDSQQNFETGSQEIRETMSNSGTNRQILTKQEEHTATSTITRRSTVPVSNGCETVIIPHRQTVAEGRLPAAIQTVANTSVMSSNLSQLADLAASQAPSQMIAYTPVSHSLQPQSSNYAPVQAGHRFYVPGQNVPLPLGPQSPLPHGYRPVAATQGMPPGMIPPPFIRGSIIQLTSGELKRVEDLTTEDFVHSTSLCPDLKLETSTVVSVRKNDEVGMGLVGFSITSTKAQVTLSCPVEHPFFVYGQGWSSCIPDQSAKKYNLQCHPLNVGDVCIFLSPNFNQAVMTIPGLPGNGIVQGAQVLSIPNQGTHTTTAHTVTGNSPGIAGSTTTVKQIQVIVTQSPGSTAQATMPQAQTSATTATTQVTHSGAHVTSQAVPPGSTITVIDPHGPGMGFLRPQLLPSQTLINQQVVVDGKTVAASGIPGQGPTYYQVPASFVSPSQTFVQTSGIPGQTSVGNGLLVTTLGFVPGQHGMPVGQPGMLYATHLSEMAQKQSKETVEASGSQEEKSDAGQPEAKRPKLDVNTE